MEKNRDIKLYGTVKVGERGQVVIPADARKDFAIKSGDLLLVMTGKNRRGVVMVKADSMRDLAERILHGLEETTEKQ